MTDNSNSTAEISAALVVEDHAEARTWLVETLDLAFSGVVVTQTATLDDSRKIIDAVRFDLALIDLGLPDGDGSDLIAALSQAQPDCIIVVTSVFADDAHVFRALRAGARGYILKEHEQDELAAMLTGIVAGRPPLSPAIARRLLDHFHTPVDEVRLTERERDVLTLLAKGFTVKKVASLLEISATTTAGYVKTIYSKLNISSRAEAATEAARRGLLGDPPRT